MDDNVDEQLAEAEAALRAYLDERGDLEVQRIAEMTRNAIVAYFSMQRPSGQRARIRYLVDWLLETCE